MQHFIANAVRQVNAFITIPDPAERELFFLGVRDPLYITQSGIVSLQCNNNVSAHPCY